MNKIYIFNPTPFIYMYPCEKGEEMTHYNVIIGTMYIDVKQIMVAVR